VGFHVGALRRGGTIGVLCVFGGAFVSIGWGFVRGTPLKHE
jgi:hypothetical protein